MKKPIFFLILFGILFPLHIRAADCTYQKQTISHLLAEGISRIRVRSEQVNSSNLSTEEKHDFKTDAEWVSAWTRDIIQRLTPEMEEKEEGIQCFEIDKLIANIRAQWKPLTFLSRSLFIRSIINNSGEEDYGEISEIFVDAGNAKDLTESRILLRRALFRLRNEMRESRKADITP